MAIDKDKWLEYEAAMRQYGLAVRRVQMLSPSGKMPPMLLPPTPKPPVGYPNGNR